MSQPLHYVPLVEWNKPRSSYLCGGEGLGTSNMFSVSCPDCKDLLAQGKRQRVIHYTRGKKPFLCGAMDGSAVNLLDMVNCLDCIGLYPNGGVAVQPPLHTPPLMNENEDGIFLFHDVHNGKAYTLEVVPQTTGNVEFVVSWPTPEGEEDDGRLFTLSHLDRADLLRALLHDFHYSPERGGPHDDLNN